ncbi:MAG: cytidylate kinase-like family protein [Desulfohalobiaceae bacterium]|nr:cytidylate kinase-like family protein [Desulfohalobiaceae bacterium]
MAVITISRGSYSKGKEIAEKLAENLGYECISRDILLEASTHFNIPEVKLVRAIHDAPSVLERFKDGKKRYMSFIREALLEHIEKDNVVYHGLAGHFFVQGIPNIMKVRIIADIEGRVKEEMERENVSEKEARHLLVKDDEERRKWSLFLYGIDTRDASLYDIVLHIDNLKVQDAVDFLTDIARRPCFQMTEESRRIIKDYLLGAKAESAIVDRFPFAEVKSRNGVVSVRIETTLSLETENIEFITDVLKDIEGVKEVRVQAVPIDVD